MTDHDVSSTTGRSHPDRARLLVTGAHGQLGRALTVLAPDSIGYSRGELDITDAEAVRKIVNPGDVLINCAAYTAVDRAESEVEAASAVNATGPRVLAQVCAENGARLVHVSTDYVFPGTAAQPYEPDDPTGPSTVYGRSKLAGEQAVREFAPDAHIVRTAWVYTGHGTDFVATMRRLERERDTITVVDDQLGSPTYAPDLAAGLLELATGLLEANPAFAAGRILHATNAGQATWFDLARAVFAGLGADPDRVQPCGTEDFPRPAPRPAYSVLSGKSWAAAGLTPLRHWKLALNDALAAISDYPGPP
ncbi:dTDP-4-dehydrorhamnose reductase [Nocardia seriolae]|uniref:dTDP-4-dehydrorhamnose reductase n=1 Tax=Nocardia seriolae TaxID=37332 RepID=A0ABC8APY8_9NOCA|nr:dTDP-4-dehydrorhamnose reductase [Nocardia seriolae]APA96124.1 dTDP-4-dehydrorhamnose reductase [Nocardia seriolae]WKY53787.1 dTDP-4-dehydrorhamnose reductase [Nocardia seriolae]BAW09501.1 dTDP-4-dehydrorhamnose reductase [Nocardia seriolae]BEK85616.1 dTDP-4-dehydrorhamnose reductase [Nocardia seriolae]BEK98557.1 dTDP-4-dehydrorhamnose reductase [Nocardia seriolae]